MHQTAAMHDTATAAPTIATAAHRGCSSPAVRTTARVVAAASGATNAAAASAAPEATRVRPSAISARSVSSAADRTIARDGSPSEAEPARSAPEARRAPPRIAGRGHAARHEQRVSRHRECGAVAGDPGKHDRARDGDERDPLEQHGVTAASAGASRTLPARRGQAASRRGDADRGERERDCRTPDGADDDLCGDRHRDRDRDADQPQPRRGVAREERGGGGHAAAPVPGAKGGPPQRERRGDRDDRGRPTRSAGTASTATPTSSTTLATGIRSVAPPGRRSVGATNRRAAISTPAIAAKIAPSTCPVGAANASVCHGVHPPTMACAAGTPRSRGPPSG